MERLSSVSKELQPVEKGGGTVEEAYQEADGGFYGARPDADEQP